MVSDAAGCPLCGAALEVVHSFTKPPPGESDFKYTNYHREVWQCHSCGHVVNRHSLPLEGLYAANYVDSVYGERLSRTFEKIMALAPEKSDNRQRVARINAYADTRGIDAPRRALDVGAGLGVFPAALAETGWQCVAIEPDARAAGHIAERTGARALCGDFMTFEPDGRYDLVTFNKVLEHVEPMTEMLARARHWLSPRGIVYFELPDGEAAIEDSPAREEFFIEHYCAFGVASLALFVRRARLRCELIERIREPSGKYTLYAFLTAP